MMDKPLRTIKKRPGGCGHIRQGVGSEERHHENTVSIARFNQDDKGVIL